MDSVQNWICLMEDPHFPSYYCVRLELRQAYVSGTFLRQWASRGLLGCDAVVCRWRHMDL
jgi:hypothetical protein